jgi:hypothetical protein
MLRMSVEDAATCPGPRGFVPGPSRVRPLAATRYEAPRAGHEPRRQCDNAVALVEAERLLCGAGAVDSTLAVAGVGCTPDVAPNALAVGCYPRVDVSGRGAIAPPAPRAITFFLSFRALERPA